MQKMLYFLGKKIARVRDSNMNYDQSNIFAKILRKEIPAKIVYEDEIVLAFEDINPQAPVHVLVIPKGSYVSFDDFSKNSQDLDLFFKTVGKIARDLGIVESGYRVVMNHGKDAGQLVPHFHAHILGRKKMDDGLC